MKCVIVFICVIHVSYAVAQTGQISGVVQDSATLEVLPFASVFINNTTLGTRTNSKGEFILKDIPDGLSEIVFSFVGYQTYQTRIKFNAGESIHMNVKLLPYSKELPTVVVKAKRDKEWAKKFQKFEKIFLGQDAVAASCKILNSGVIDFPKGPRNEFLAQAAVPIEIANQALGYKVYFYLTEFKATSDSYTIGGNTRFEELTPEDNHQYDQWAENRQNVYDNSYQHFFKAIIDKRIRGEGFVLYTDKPGFENSNVRSSSFHSELGKSVIPYDTSNIVHAYARHRVFGIFLKGRIEIHYLYDEAQIKTYKDTPFPVSWMEVKGDSVLVNQLGIPLNPSAVVTSGAMNLTRVSHLLPLNYEAPNLTGRKYYLKPLQEKVYIHTDKPYYYPGEAIWFKGYLNYRIQSLRDSLSKVLYVELIGPKKSVVLTRILKIDSGSVKGDFVLPDTISPGNYLLRAYSQWMRNYGKDYFFQKPVTIVNFNERVDPAMATQGLKQDSSIVIQSSKSTYHTREKIELEFLVRDKKGKPMASCLSVAVTDFSQVIPVPDDFVIPRVFPWSANLDSSTHFQIRYPIELGINISGNFVNNHQQPEKTQLTVMKGKFEDLMIVDVNKKGHFNMNGLDFYDSARFAFQAKDEKGRPYGKTVLEKRAIPPIVEMSGQNLKIIKEETQQQPAADYKPKKGEILLQSVTVKARKIKEEKKDPEIQHLMYGKPDWTVKGEDMVLTGNNLLASLQGRVPSLQIYSVWSDGMMHYVLRVRGGLASIVGSPEPMVVIDGIVMGGGSAAVDAIANLTPANVDRVEVTTRLNSMYGAQGAAGVIAIFTKTNQPGNSKDDPSIKSFDVFKVAGYYKPRNFLFPNYSDPKTDSTQIDYRSTIYWNPEVRTGSKTGTTDISFYAADLKSTYRVVVEGVTEKGDPIRSEFSIEVN